jgi:epoxyqueuosine reductase
MDNTLFQQLQKQGYRARAVPIRHLQNLKEAIEGPLQQGLLDADVYREYLAGFVFKPPEGMPEARSLIVVAYADPQVRFVFNWKGSCMPTLVPPTYLHEREKDRRAEKTLAQLLEPRGHQVAQAVVPKKLLAVCSGLAEYGKNNIAYVAGMGSFHRLAAFYSDLPCSEQDVWQKPRMLEPCERCKACTRNCPAGAIDAGRFLLRAERCITFWNEKPAGVFFPVWVEAAWHNCLVGCMHCQRVCPENRRVLDWYEEGAEFSEDETRLLLEGVPQDALPPGLVEKLQQWDLLELLGLLPRNLRALLEK